MIETTLQRLHGIFGWGTLGTNLVTNLEIEGDVFIPGREVFGRRLVYRHPVSGLE